MTAESHTFGETAIATPANAITVGVEKRAGINLIKNGVVPPSHERHVSEWRRENPNGGGALAQDASLEITKANR